MRIKIGAIELISQTLPVLLAVFSTHSLFAQNKASTPVNPSSAAIGEFKGRTNDYLKIHKQVAAKLKPLKTTPAAKEIVDYQQQLARGIVAARQAARPGNIFTDPIIAEFRRLIGIAMSGPNGKNVRASLARSEPVTIEVTVNGQYPPGIPLQSSPPTMLLNLPRLPAELDYRIVGNALVLRDVKANLIVDFMPNAIPREVGGLR